MLEYILEEYYRNTLKKSTIIIKKSTIEQSLD